MKIVITIIIVLVLGILTTLLLIDSKSNENTEAVPSGTTYTNLSDTTLVREVSVEDPIVATGGVSTEFRNFLDNIHTEESEQIECKGKINDRALVYTAKQSIGAEETIKEIIFYPLEAWEPYMLRDKGDWLIPETSDKANLPLLEFTIYDDYTKMASYELGEQNKSLYYTWRLNYLIIATSLNCLEKVGNDIYRF